MKSSSVMTIRIPPDLLEALKEKAREDGRTVSGEVIHLVRRHVGPSAPPRARFNSSGMFADAGFECPELEELIALRHQVSAAFLLAAPKKRKRPA